MKKPDGKNLLRKRVQKRTVNMGTWNIQSLTGRNKQVFEQLNEFLMDIISLTGTKRKGTGNEI